MTKYRFYVKQNGLTVASGECPTLEECQSMGMHYAMQYANEGPVKLEIKETGKKEPKP